MAAPATAAAVVYLYVRIFTADNGGEESRTAFANWETCKQALASARVSVATGGDSEGIVAMWCGGDRQWQDIEGNWHRSGVKPDRR